MTGLHDMEKEKNGSGAENVPVPQTVWWPGLEGDRAPPSAKVKPEWIYNSIPPHTYALTATCLPPWTRTENSIDCTSYREWKSCKLSHSNVP